MHQLGVLNPSLSLELAKRSKDLQMKESLRLVFILITNNWIESETLFYYLSVERFANFTNRREIHIVGLFSG